MRKFSEASIRKQQLLSVLYSGYDVSFYCESAGVGGHCLSLVNCYHFDGDVDKRNYIGQLYCKESGRSRYFAIPCSIWEYRMDKKVTIEGMSQFDIFLERGGIDILAVKSELAGMILEDFPINSEHIARENIYTKQGHGLFKGLDYNSVSILSDAIRMNVRGEDYSDMNNRFIISGYETIYGYRHKDYEGIRNFLDNASKYYDMRYGYNKEREYEYMSELEDRQQEMNIASWGSPNPEREGIGHDY